MFDGDYGIRVDHVSDIGFIPTVDKMAPSAWREQLPEITAASGPTPQ